MKKRYKFILTILLAAAMLLLPIGAAFFNGTNAVTAFADGAKRVLLFEDNSDAGGSEVEETVPPETEENTAEPAETGAEPPGSETDGAESEIPETGGGETEPPETNNTETEPPETDDTGTEPPETETDGTEMEPSETETAGTETEPVETETDGTETEPPGSEVEPTEPETEPTETETETAGSEETVPNVKITIQAPAGWYRDRAKVKISVEDVKESGKFKIASVEAQISHGGSYEDITEDMYLEISENCSIYVKVTDQDGRVYQKNRYVECFDKEKPTLNAAIYDGLLNVQAIDNDSGVKAVYVNGYEFTDLNNGVLNIRLQQFDTGYQYFTLQAEDNAGNMSQVYKMTNPYYSDPQKQNSNGGNTETTSRLPQNVLPSAPTDAKGTVTEHTASDNTVTAGISGSVKKESEKGSVEKEDINHYTVQEAEGGKEFYTIQTKNGKVFYLIVDKELSTDNVLLLTEVSENDLLNFTQAINTQVLPQNAAVMESAIPEETESEAESVAEETEVQDQEQESDKKESNAATYILIIIVALGVGGIYYFRKRMRDDGDYDDYEDDEDGEADSDDGSEEAE